MNKEDLSLYQSEIQSSVSFTAFMTAVTTFFTGLLLTRFESLDITIKIPILFLIISTFGFLYATLVYANASGEITRHDGRKADRYMFVGNVISEYLGVYLMVLAVPLVINAITGDLFLRVATFIVAITGLFIYSISDFSIINRYFTDVPQYFFSGLVVIFETVLFIAQIGVIPYFVYLAIVLLLFVIFTAYYFLHTRG